MRGIRIYIDYNIRSILGGDREVLGLKTGLWGKKIFSKNFF